MASWIATVMVMPTEPCSRRDLAVSHFRNARVPPPESARTRTRRRR